MTTSWHGSVHSLNQILSLKINISIMKQTKLNAPTSSSQVTAALSCLSEEILSMLKSKRAMTLVKLTFLAVLMIMKWMSCWYWNTPSYCKDNSLCNHFLTANYFHWAFKTCRRWAKSFMKRSMSCSKMEKSDLRDFWCKSFVRSRNANLTNTSKRMEFFK